MPVWLLRWTVFWRQKMQRDKFVHAQQSHSEGSGEYQPNDAHKEHPSESQLEELDAHAGKE